MKLNAVMKSESAVQPSEPPAGGAVPASSTLSSKAETASPGSRPKRALNLEPLLNVLTMIGLAFLVPIIRLCRGENPGAQARDLWKLLGIPVVAIVVFMFAWDRMSHNIETSLGKIPGPAAVWEAAGGLWTDHKTEREKAVAFYERQQKRSAEKLADDPSAEIVVRKYTGKPTYLDQIITSLKTVFTGFLIASLVAIPIGILCGLSSSFHSAFNPLIQVFKPVSPLAWLPIVTMLVSALYVTSDPMFPKSFLISAITVALCSLWPTIINTTLGVASIDKDLLNVAKVLQLGWTTKLVKLVLPSSLPLIFTGLRLSLGVGWMVLIASEMLAQNPGLGKFIWDEFQNGSSESLARILVAVFTIGIIGFLLDRIMLTIQSMVSFGDKR